MPGSGGTSNLSMSHFIGAGLTLRSRLRHHRPKGQHANSRTFASLVIWRRDGARLTSGWVKLRRTQCEYMFSALHLKLGHCSMKSACLKRANMRHRSSLRQGGVHRQVRTVSCAPASAVRGTRRGVPTSSRVAPAAHDACMSRPLRCSRAPPNGAPRSRLGCRPSRNPPPDRPHP
jgi:hypothetical protein